MTDEGRDKRLPRTKRRVAALVAACCLVLAGAQGASAYLKDTSGTLHNTLSRRGNPDVRIDEQLGSVKQVRITNVGESATKVMVRVSVIYRSDTAAADVLPATGVAFTGGDPYWVWNGYSAQWPDALPPGMSTGLLFGNVTADPAPAGYHLEVKVIAQNLHY